MPQAYSTTLRPASGGFGEWDWIEPVEVEGCESYEEYEALLDDPHGAGLNGRWERSEDLAGRIHNERGRVYRLAPAPDEISYEMVWLEEG